MLTSRPLSAPSATACSTASRKVTCSSDPERHGSRQDRIELSNRSRLTTQFTACSICNATAKRFVSRKVHLASECRVTPRQLVAVPTIAGTEAKETMTTHWRNDCRKSAVSIEP